MKRVLVVGCPGAGKSTFARKLREKTGLPLHYLDMLWWKPDKSHIPREEFDAKLKDIVAGDEWIIDGNYSRTLAMRLERADTVFMLDFPLDICLAGAKSRVGTNRVDLPWVEDEFDSIELANWIVDFPKQELPKVYQLVAEYGKGKDIHIFHTRAEADAYIQNMDRLLSICVDMYGCPNRCKHCWLGHMPNKKMEDGADEFVVNYFSLYFDKIDFYSWLREPDFSDDYRARWQKDVELSKNAKPERFELASFWRIVRDKDYIPFLKEVGVKKVQLTFFGKKDTQDKYVGRKGAYEEALKATDLLMDAGIIPRWQCFINEENKGEIVELYRLAMEIKNTKCKEFEFFVHEGTCDGENRKLYSIRINKGDIPSELAPVFLNYDGLLTERECCEILKNDTSHPDFDLSGDLVFYVSNTFDVYYNFTNMTEEWISGNLKKDKPEELVPRLLAGDTYALKRAKEVTLKELVERYGDFSSDKVFDLDDYKIYLFNNYLKDAKE